MTVALSVLWGTCSPETLSLSRSQSPALARSRALEHAPFAKTANMLSARSMAPVKNVQKARTVFIMGRMAKQCITTRPCMRMFHISSRTSSPRLTVRSGTWRRMSRASTLYASPNVQSAMPWSERKAVRRPTSAKNATQPTAILYSRPDGMETRVTLGKAIFASRVQNRQQVCLALGVRMFPR